PQIWMRGFRRLSGVPPFGSGRWRKFVARFYSRESRRRSQRFGPPIPPADPWDGAKRTTSLVTGLEWGWTYLYLLCGRTASFGTPGWSAFQQNSLSLDDGGASLRH